MNTHTGSVPRSGLVARTIAALSIREAFYRIFWIRMGSAAKTLTQQTANERGELLRALPLL